MNNKKLKATINFHLKILLTYQQKYKDKDDFYIETYNYLKNFETTNRWEFTPSQKQILDHERNIKEG